jgi:aminopeptidase N
MDLTFDVHDDHTKVYSALHVESLDSPLSEILLNAKNLEIISVRCPGNHCSHQYDAEASVLTVQFEKPVEPATHFTLFTETVCRPTKNILEGLYFDETPPGAPPQQITQCQQWGFQRLVPCIDDPPNYNFCNADRPSNNNSHYHDYSGSRDHRNGAAVYLTGD